MKICMRTYTSAGFVRTRIWKPPNCPSTGDWINALGAPLNGILRSNQQGWVSDTQPVKWVSKALFWAKKKKKCRPQKVTYCMIPSITLSEWYNHRDNRSVVARAWGWGKDVITKRLVCENFFVGIGTVLYPDGYNIYPCDKISQNYVPENKTITTCKNWWNPNKVWFWVNNTAPMSVSWFWQCTVIM